ncbi:flagellar motor protein MotB [Acuticoccus sp.]|uniref:flagellar motor protein MotB n=1 Tax=Acuticoccus sp. TaxID=1904378 RepID=UPI003B52CFC4
MTDTSSEIIILKRVEEVAEAKKGGVWKIAHADFMTAMMAFFLIMWLVNATDEEIKKSIANYFNPMNLMDAPTDVRGLADPTRDMRPPASGDTPGHAVGNHTTAANSMGEGGAATGGGNAEVGDQNRMDSAGLLNETDGAVFHDPYATLASADIDVDPEDPVAVDVPQTSIGDAGHTKPTDEPRDPFDPAYWQTTSERASQSLQPGSIATAQAEPDPALFDAADRVPTAASPAPAGARNVAMAAHGPDAASEPLVAGGRNALRPDVVAQQEAPAQPAAVVAPRSALAEAVLAAYGDDRAAADGRTDEGNADGNVATARKEAVDRAAAVIAGELAEVAADVAVVAGERSVLIALTDDTAFSMFPIGSAEPTAAAIGLFGRVADALADRDGRIVVRGHTDARQFAAGSSDNWVLSFERAHATKAALVARGVAERRIARVEGLADREPTVPEDPYADENRRIEILYEPSTEVTP